MDARKKGHYAVIRNRTLYIDGKEIQSENIGGSNNQNSENQNSSQTITEHNKYQEKNSQRSELHIQQKRKQLPPTRNYSFRN